MMQDVNSVLHGHIVKIVSSFGARWGRIQPAGATRSIFFNQASLPEGIDLADLREGQAVEFREEPDRANGTRAVEIVLSAVQAQPVAKWAFSVALDFTVGRAAWFMAWCGGFSPPPVHAAGATNVSSACGATRTPRTAVAANRAPAALISQWESPPNHRGS